MKNRADKIKAAFFDIDGTLLSHVTKSVPESARKAIQQLRRQGIPCVIATGRHIIEMTRLPLGGMTFDGYITLNGQLCVDGAGEVFWENPIEGVALDNILKVFHGDEVCLMLIEKDTMYLNFVDDHVRITQASISTPVAPLGEYTGKPVYQAIAYLEKGWEDSFAEKIPGCSLTRWNDHAVDMISQSGGKVAGIREFIRLHGISREETIAFGDGINDIEMLAFAGIGVCMGNGHPQAKEAADYVTADLEDDGIEKALKHFGLL